MNEKILILSRSDNRGDGIAAYDLAKSLIAARYNVILMVSFKTRTDEFIIEPTIIQLNNSSGNIFNRLLKKMLNKLSSVNEKATPAIEIDNKYDFFINQEVENQLSEESVLKDLPFTPNLIIACSIHHLVNTTTLAALKKRTKAEVYMLTMDMAPLTGGCQHAWSCNGYKVDCSNCPAIIKDEYKDIAHKNLMIKLNNIRTAGIKILVASGRLYEQAKSSALFKNQKDIYNINSFINTDVFNNKNRGYAKHIFDLPTNSKVIFTGAEYTNNERKGINFFIEGLNFLWLNIDDNLKEEIVILIAGRNEKYNDVLDKIPFKKKLIDFITDERLLSLAYQSADVFVCSSIEDPGPRMVTQALACGTPVVGFEMGILYNMVLNGYNGYKVELRNSQLLADGMKSVLSLNKNEFKQFSENATKHVKDHSSSHTVLNVFSKMLNNSVA